VGRRLVAVIALLCFTGCSWTATIGRTDALDNEAEIEHSDADALYLRARNGRIHRVERNSIRTIDHPGNVEIIIGALLIGLGAFAATSSNNRDDVAPLLIVYGTSGLSLILSGMIRYIPSLRAGWAFQSADPPPKKVPPGTYPPPPASYPPPPPAPPQQPPPPEDEQPEVIPNAT
jgi:predicted phage tail protein